MAYEGMAKERAESLKRHQDIQIWLKEKQMEWRRRHKQHVERHRLMKKAWESCGTKNYQPCKTGNFGARPF